MDSRARSAVPSTVLRLEGRDALSLLHRISTRSLLDLEPGQARWTLYCDFRGRLLYRALVAATSDGAVWLLRDDAPGAPLAAHLHAHVFREEVRIGLGDGRWSARLVPATEGIPAGAVAEAAGVIEWVQAGPDVAMALVPAGTHPPGLAAERHRIRAGRPRHGHEIAEEFNPYEVNLGGEVHLSKGCYTGQEALQRLVTYGSVRRRLARVAGAGAAPPAPARVLAGDGPAGALTSTVDAGDDVGWIGLAVLRHEACGPGVALRLESGGEIAHVEPFAPASPEGR